MRRLLVLLMLLPLAAHAECGIASTYSSGTRTANGERYDHMGISAAHRTLPFGSRVVVRNQRTGRAITVRINDRGPFVAGRVVDLSTGANRALGGAGLTPVCLEVLSYGSGVRGYRRAEFQWPKSTLGSKLSKAGSRLRKAFRRSARALFSHRPHARRHRRRSAGTLN